MEEEKKKATWVTADLVTEAGSPLAIQIQKSDHPRPEYSSRLGRIFDNRFIPWLRKRFRTTNGAVELEKIDGEVFQRLLDRAHEIELRLRQEFEDQQQEHRRQQQERKQLGNRPQLRNVGQQSNAEEDWEFNR